MVRPLPERWNTRLGNQNEIGGIPIENSLNQQQLQALQTVIRPNIMSLLKEHGMVITLPKGASCLAPDTAGYQPGVAYLVSGVLRITYYDEFHNASIADYLYKQGNVLVACVQDQNVCSCQALTEVELVRLPLDDTLEAASIGTNDIIVDALREVSARQLEIAAVLRDHDAEARYRWFLARYRGIVGIESHRNIAAFLGVAPETLSRVRAKLRKTTPTEA